MHQSKWLQRLPFFTIVILGIKILRRTLPTWQNMVWTAFLSFGDLCKSSQVLSFTCLVVVGISVEKRKLRTWPDMVWKAFLLFCDSCQSSQVALCTYQNASVGYFLSSSCDFLEIQFKRRELRTSQNMAWKALLLFRDLC